MVNSSPKPDGVVHNPTNSPASSKKPGAPIKAFTFTRERAASLGDIKDYLNRKRTIDNRDPDDSPSDSEETTQAAKKMFNQASNSASLVSNPDAMMSDLSNTGKAHPISALLGRLTDQIAQMQSQANNNTEALKEQIKNSQRENQNAIQAIRDDFLKSEKTLLGRIDNISKRQDKLDKELEALKSGNISLSTTNPSSEAEVNKARLHKLEDLVSQQEKAAKRLNIIAKNHNWREPNLIHQINEFMEEKFSLSNAVIDVIPMRQDRKVLKIKLSNEKAKDTVMNAKRTVLKGSTLSLNNEYTNRELYCLKKIKETAADMRKNGKNPKIKGTRLEMNNELFVWDFWEDQLKSSINRSLNSQNSSIPTPSPSTDTKNC
ncbi:rab11 family-interacting protein 3-like [Neodiprion pinetum]|uniref:rab11 family-interacting protein 3-like n=1 Tax=Neodiprion pinetum TaxID=441929 RepID=UPI00371F21A6